MKLKSIKIENFRSIKCLEFEFPKSGLLILVGPNNAGKSNIISAIDVVCGDSWFGRDKMDDHDFYLRDRGRPLCVELTFDNGRKAKLNSEEKWPKYTNQDGRKIYDSSVKEDFPCTYLGADRTFDKHLSFYDWTLIGKIRRQFHLKARPLQDALHQKFAELTEIFDQVDGFSEFKADFSQFFNEMQADTPARLEITFEPFTPANYFKTMQILATDPNQGDEPLDLSELGEGSRNTILLALLRSYAMNFRQSNTEGLSGILALEEPEIFLHPQARRHLYKVLREIADSGMQVVISTHSASFVDTEHFDSIGKVSKTQDEEFKGRTYTDLTLVSKAQLVRHCRATGVPAPKVNVANITEFYRTTSNYRLNEAFFAKYIILVEGETEELTLPEYLLREGIDCDLQGISMIAVGGKNQIPKYWRLFSLFTDDLMAVFDNDAADESKQRSNLNLCSCFGLEPKDVTKVNLHRLFTSTLEKFTPLIVLQSDFETALILDFAEQYPDDVGLLDEYENEGKELIKPVGSQCKGQLARFVARKLAVSHPAYVPGFVSEIAEVLRHALGIR